MQFKLPQWRSQEIEIGGKFIFTLISISPTVYRTQLAHLVGSGASIGKKGFESTISVFGGVARKFSLVKIPILHHWGQFFPIFSYGEKKIFGPRGAMADLAKG